MIALLLLSACNPWPFEVAVPSGVPADVSTERLCAESFESDPSEHQYIDCAVELAGFGQDDAPDAGPLRVLSWNLERGHHLDGQIAWLQSGEAPLPDILMISEADRGCERTDGRHVAREIAEDLGMHMAYAVEFVEQSGQGTDVTTACEHGNALLSRWPMGNVEAFRHEAQMDIWFTPPDQRGEDWSTRLGGRISVAADIRVHDELLHAISVHWASGGSDQIAAQQVRESHAAETVAHAQLRPHPAIVAGDTNAGFYMFDLSSGDTNDGVTQAFLTEGWTDAHHSLAPNDRVTSPPLILDLLFGKADQWSEAAICAAETCDGLSDHRAVWATWTP